VLEVAQTDVAHVLSCFAAEGIGALARVIARTVMGAARLQIAANGSVVLDEAIVDLASAWSETSFRMRERRDDPQCAREEFTHVADAADPGLSARLTYDLQEDVSAPYIATGARPRVAVLREQGCNSQLEMAAVFASAGFEAHDVHMTDIIGGAVTLADYPVVVAVGGFSYGDVLGAGEGWAKSILFNPRARDEFFRYFERADTLTLGVCNGCQMLAALAELIPGTAHWPRFKRNRSEQFEARLTLVEVTASRSPFFAGMAGSVLPIAVSHGEGRDVFAHAAAEAAFLKEQGTTLRYVDHYGQLATTYPRNPNGSPHGIAGITSGDGRVTLTMPHPERVYRAAQNSWHPPEWSDAGGWLRMFQNARVALG